LPLALAFVASLSSCAVLRAADYATDAFMRESDPELARSALPTMMKASEALLLADPGSPQKALTTASLYIMYANAFLDGEAFLLSDDAYDQKQMLSRRANALYLRAADLLVPLVEIQAPGLFGDSPQDGRDSKVSIGRFKIKDVPLLYWTAASILGAFAGDPMNFDNASRISGALALFERARALDPGWNAGGLHALAISLYGSRPEDLGGDRDAAAAAFDLAIAASGSKAPGPYVAYATSFCVPAGDSAGFKTALETALKLDIRPESALMDALAHRKAQRLLDDMSLYF